MAYFMGVAGPFDPSIAGLFLLSRMRRVLYLVVFAALVACLVAGGLYYRHRAGTGVTGKPGAANCDTPAPPPPPKEQPKLPDFAQPGCGAEPAKTPAKPATVPR
jgi:hypothetical protein